MTKFDCRRDFHFTNTTKIPTLLWIRRGGVIIVLRWFYSGSTVVHYWVLQWFYGGSTVVQYSGSTVVLQWFYGGSTR